MKRITQETINQVVNSSVPERLSLDKRPPIADDHVAHILALTLWGQTTLAADHLLFPEINGALVRTVTGVIRKLNILFARSKWLSHDDEASFQSKALCRQYAYESLLEMALNFLGLESRWLDEKEKKECLDYILYTLQEWENLERNEGEVSIAAAVIAKWLSRMKRVQQGHSMAAKTALRIEGSLNLKKTILTDFLNKATTEIKENIYYHMVNEGKCKFGNDYALGLRWLRHLGFEQVSTNPVLAAKAYQDEPALTEIFREEVKQHPRFKQWATQPSNYAGDITLFATLLALWDNLHVFRPLFFNLRETSGGGIVSFQLNPNIAHLVEESLRDAFKAFSLASENLSIYDRYLLAGYPIDREKGRPNMVIKVAASSPAARTITRAINSFGFGSNITVDYSVGQEATLILDEMDGMAKALKKGIRPTQLYMTNMGGRLESHLRELMLEKLFQGLRNKIGENKAMEKVRILSEINGTKDKGLKVRTYEEKVWAATRFAHGQKKIDGPVFEALRDIASEKSLQDWEEAINQSGTLVARRVWGFFFSKENRERWITLLIKKYDLTQEQAHWLMDRIHYLPASKRKPFDTYWTLSSRNLVHTEFPDHQENVRKMAEEPLFSLKKYEESISHPFFPDPLPLLNQMEDFRKAYEIDPELSEIFKEVGIFGDFGLRGLTPSEWPEFGPVQKTLAEFKSAYDTFQKDIVTLLQELLRKKETPKVKKGKKNISKKRK